MSLSKTSTPAKETILVVEDNEDLRVFLNNQLGKYYQIITTSNGVEAMETLKKHIISLIISDVMIICLLPTSLCCLRNV